MGEASAYSNPQKKRLQSPKQEEEDVELTASDEDALANEKQEQYWSPTIHEKRAQSSKAAASSARPVRLRVEKFLRRPSPVACDFSGWN